MLGSEERSDMMTTYTVYIVEVAIEGIGCKIFLRYREFNELQNMMRKTFPKIMLPFASEKQIFGNHDSKIIDARKLQI